MVSKVTFRSGGRKHEWTIKHNLDSHGLNIEDALINWDARNMEPPTVESFCKYVTSKDPINIKCESL